MINPWLKLSLKPPYILKKDIALIKEFNKNAKAEYRIFTDLLPGPYCGNPFTAKIILLQLNPGVDSIVGYENDGEDFVFNKYPSFKKDIFDNIRHKQSKYPFFHLNPEYRLLGGFRYWAEKFSPFIKSKDDYIRISNKICVIEFFPYHSIKYDKKLDKLLFKCQKYNFLLVELAIKRREKIIIMRGKKQWLSNVPKLRNKYLTLKSSRNVILSKANLGEKNFEKVKKILNP